MLWFPPDIRDVIWRAARSESPVLITGESGTGKEQVARAIHKMRDQKVDRRIPGRPFVTVDCGSVVGPLMESELFGHLRGSFTGADRDKKGLIAEASDGTVFFDEIGDLEMPLQPKLLRLLQEHEYRPVGATKYETAKIRPVFATHRDLRRRITEGLFREDLYYRLAVLPVHLCPLRERQREIPGLIDYFVRCHASRPLLLSSELIEALVGYAWPGNIRELGNVIERMMTMGDGNLTLDDLPEEIARPDADSRRSHTGSEPVSLAEAERLHVTGTLTRYAGNRTRTAEALGISRAALWRKLKSYGK